MQAWRSPRQLDLEFLSPEEDSGPGPGRRRVRLSSLAMGEKSAEKLLEMAPEEALHAALHLLVKAKGIEKSTETLFEVHFPTLRPLSPDEHAGSTKHVVHALVSIIANLWVNRHQERDDEEVAKEVKTCLACLWRKF